MEQKPIPSIQTMIKSKSENIMSFKIAIARISKNDFFQSKMVTKLASISNSKQQKFQKCTKAKA